MLFLSPELQVSIFLALCSPLSFAQLDVLQSAAGGRYCFSSCLHIQQRFFPSSINDDVINLCVCICMFCHLGMSRSSVNIFVQEQGSSNDQVALLTQIAEPVFIVNDVTISIFPHVLWAAIQSDLTAFAENKLTSGETESLSSGTGPHSSGIDCLLVGLDCLLERLDCLLVGLDCLLVGLDRLLKKLGISLLTQHPLGG